MSSIPEATPIRMTGEERAVLEDLAGSQVGNAMAGRKDLDLERLTIFCENTV
jgi:hypothetical protein